MAIPIISARTAAPSAWRVLVIRTRSAQRLDDTMEEEEEKERQEAPGMSIRLIKSPPTAAGAAVKVLTEFKLPIYARQERMQGANKFGGG